MKCSERNNSSYPALGARYEGEELSAITAPIFLRNLNCAGTERSLLYCNAAPAGIPSDMCTHENDVRITCQGTHTHNTHSHIPHTTYTPHTTHYTHHHPHHTLSHTTHNIYTTYHTPHKRTPPHLTQHPHTTHTHPYTPLTPHRSHPPHTHHTTHRVDRDVDYLPSSPTF